MTGPSETVIVRYIIAQLSEKYPNDIWERQNVVMAQAVDRVIRAGTVGQADIRGCHAGRYIELEVKKVGKKQTPAQLQRQINVTRAGGTYAVVHSPQEAFAIVEGF